MVAYAEMRPVIKTGDLLAFPPLSRGWWGRFQANAVRTATQSEFSHIGIAYVIYDRVFVLESVSTGVRMFPLYRALPFFTISNPKPLSSAALEWAFSKIGYAYESKFKMVLAFIFKLKTNKNERYQCAEYVNGILAANGQQLAVSDTPSIIVNMAMRQWGGLIYVNK